MGDTHGHGRSTHRGAAGSRWPARRRGVAGSLRSVRGWALAGAAALLAVPAGGVAAQEAADAPRLTRSVHATADDVAPTRTYSAPYMLVAPDDPLTVVASTVEMRARTCHLLRSTDGGQTWALLDASPSPDDYPFCFHTSGMTTMSPMDWGRDGTLYLAMSGWSDADVEGDPSGGHGGLRGNLSVMLARSDDLGDTWDPVVAHDVRGSTGEAVENNRPVSSVAVDRSTGSQDSVYIGWMRRLPLAEDAPREPMVAASSDGGRTFSEPVSAFGDYERDTGEGTLGAGAAPSVAVGDGGTVYVLFTASGRGAPSTLMVARSTDGAQTFETTAVDEISGQFAYPVMRWAPGGGEQGTLHLVYEDKPGEPTGDRDVYYRHSTDGGTTWSNPLKLNDDDPAQAFGQYNASVSVAPDGRVDAVWWDFRDDPGFFANDVYYAYSTDNGETWSQNLRVTDRSIPRKIGTWSNGFDMRQPPGVASHDAYAVVGWDDTRLGDDVGQAQDVFTGAVQFSAVPAGSTGALEYAAAGLAGLVVAGLVLLLAGLRVRSQPAPPTQRQREPARV